MIQYFAIILATCCLSIAVDKSPNDPRTFDHQVLENGIEVLFITDPDARHAGASMLVDVGSMDDPDDALGLAHFLEHMLFIGTKKYPKVDYLMEYVGLHGGQANAMTGLDMTQYLFVVDPAHFATAVDIFTEFFIEPSLDEAYIEREKNAVHAEFMMNKQGDGWRGYHIRNITSNPRHPKSRFTIGNLDTLVDGEKTLQQSLQDLYKQFYVASNMHFVAVIPEDSPELKAAMRQQLSKIPAGEKRGLNTRAPILTDKERASVATVKSLRDDRELVLEFSMPAMASDYKNAALSYVTSIIGDEGEGSLYANLQADKLATGLNVETGRVTPHEVQVYISVNLTPKGLQEKDRVLSAIMQTIDMVKGSDLARWRFDEMQQSGMLSYLYYENRPTWNQLMYYPRVMRHIEPDDYNKVQFITDIHELDVGKVRTVLDELGLIRSKIFIAGPEVETDQFEPIFEIDYSNQDISYDEYRKWLMPTGYHINMPQKNQFIPKDLNLEAVKTQIIHVSQESKRSRLWRMGDASFKRPDAFVQLDIQLPVENDANDMVCKNIIARILEKRVNAALYPALKAGVSWQFSAETNGFMLSSNGMGDSALNTSSVLLDTFYSLKNTVSLDDFITAKEELSRDIKNELLDRPVQFAGGIAKSILAADIPAYHAVKQALPDIHLADLLRYLDKVDQASIEGFHYGYVTDESHASLLSNIIKHVGDAPGEFEPIGKYWIHKLEGKTDLYATSKHEDQAVVRFIQAKNDSLYDQVMTKLSSLVIKPLFFETLRTDKQLGYVVNAGSRLINQYPVLTFIVQSPSTDCEAIKGHMDEFLNDNAGLIEQMSPEQFESVKQSFIDQVSHPLANMSEVFGLHASEIHDQTYNFKLRERWVKQLEVATQAELAAWFKENVIQNDHRLDVAINDVNAKETDIAALKQATKYVPAQSCLLCNKNDNNE